MIATDPSGLQVTTTYYFKAWPSPILLERGDCESITPPMAYGETIPVLFNATWARDATEAYEGTYSYKFTKTVIAGTASYAMHVDSGATNDLHGMLPGARYRYSAKIFVPTASGIQAGEIYLRAQWYTGSWNGATEFLAGALDTWLPITLDFTLPANATSVDFEVVTETAAALNEYFYVDDIQFTGEFSILTSDPAPNFQQVADLMDASLAGGSFSSVIVGSSPNQDLRVINERDRGWESEIYLGHGTFGPNLWTNLNGFIDFDPAVPGRGAFSVDINSSVAAGGLVQIGGSAVYSFINEPPVGSIFITGNVPADSIDITGTLGTPPTSIDITGTSTYQIGYVWVAGGPLSDASEGAAFLDIVFLDDVYMSSNPASGIAVRIGGSADVAVEVIATVVPAPIVLGGTSISVVDKFYITSGGIALSGAVAVDEFALTFAPSGSAAFAGIGLTEYSTQYEMIAVGGATFAGASDTALEFVYNGLWFGDNYYPFNEKIGTAGNDSFGSNDINFFGINWTEDAPFITGVEFKKSDVGIFTSDINPQAVSFWHKRKTIDQDSYRVFGASTTGNWYFAYEPTYFRALIRNNSVDYYFFNGTDYLLIPDDDQYHWYYIDFFSGSNAAVYVDNVFRGTTVNFFGTNTHKLRYVGTDNNDTGFGPIDDLRIYSSYRLDATQRAAIYTLSPDPGSILLGGSAQVQPVIVAGHEYLYSGKGGISLTGSRYYYNVKSTAVTLGGTSPTDIEFSYTGSGGIILVSVSAFHDFGLGYIYDASGSADSDGISLTTHTRNFLYIGSGGIEISGPELLTIIIETSYFVLVQHVGKLKITGSAGIFLDDIFAPIPTGGVIVSGAIDLSEVGVVAKTPSGKAKVQGSSDTEWAPNQGYQELGL